MPNEPFQPGESYEDFLRDVKDRIRGVQVRAALAVNRELVLLYWSIGQDILARQREHGWGAKVVERLSADLRREFPEMQGFSARNLLYIRAFAEAWPDEAIVQQPVAQLPWGHNVRLLDKLKDREERLWYAREAFAYGWSRNVLVHHIESGLYRRQGQALNNFERTLPVPQSDLARELRRLSGRRIRAVSTGYRRRILVESCTVIIARLDRTGGPECRCTTGSSSRARARTTSKT